MPYRALVVNGTELAKEGATKLSVRSIFQLLVCLRGIHIVEAKRKTLPTQLMRMFHGAMSCTQSMCILWILYSV